MERDLVVRAQGGDLDAFWALTAGRTGRLYAVARLILRDDEHAADAVQDALLGAWLDLRALRDPDRFDAWLHRLLVPACYRTANSPRPSCTTRRPARSARPARAVDRRETDVRNRLNVRRSRAWNAHVRARHGPSAGPETEAGSGGSTGHDPADGLPGERRDPVVILVVVNEHRPVPLRHRGDDQVR